MSEAKIDVLREMIARTGATEEQTTGLVEGLHSFVHFMATVIECNPQAPNHITMSFLTPGGGRNYELTIRKHGGTTPADRIAALERENAELRAALSGGER